MAAHDVLNLHEVVINPATRSFFARGTGGMIALLAFASIGAVVLDDPAAPDAPTAASLAYRAPKVVSLALASTRLADAFARGEASACPASPADWSEFFSSEGNVSAASRFICGVAHQGSSDHRRKFPISRTVRPQSGSDRSPGMSISAFSLEK